MAAFGYSILRIVSIPQTLFVAPNPRFASYSAIDASPIHIARANTIRALGYLHKLNSSVIEIRLGVKCVGGGITPFRADDKWRKFEMIDSHRANCTGANPDTEDFEAFECVRLAIILGRCERDDGRFELVA